MKKKKIFSLLAFTTLIFFYLVVIAGGVVRTTGSGMGCPDWPKCFGNWIPPGSMEELPSNYKEIYAAKRQKKIEKFSGYLKGIGMRNVADKLSNDPSLLEEGDFNPFHTWTEYVNRLIGFMAGNFMLATFIVSLFFWKEDRILTVLSLINLVILVFQAWFGSIVVATNLVPWIITVHMFLALVLIGIQIKLIERAKNQSLKSEDSTIGIVKWLVIAAILFSFVQIIFGSQVRQEIDAISDQFKGLNRDAWIAQLNTIFPIHRSFSIAVAGVNAWLIYELYKHQLLKRSRIFLSLIIGLEILSGIILAYWGVPRFAQPLHLVAATVMFGIQINVFCEIWGLKKNKINSPTSMY